MCTPVSPVGQSTTAACQAAGDGLCTSGDVDRSGETAGDRSGDRLRKVSPISTSPISTSQAGIGTPAMVLLRVRDKSGTKSQSHFLRSRPAGGFGFAARAGLIETPTRPALRGTAGPARSSARAANGCSRRRQSP
jgi:hypothetical protein